MDTPITAHRLPDLRPVPATTIPADRFRRFRDPAPDAAPTLDVELSPTGTCTPAPARAALPDAAEWVATIVTAVLEAMEGQRSVVRLQRYLGPEVARRVARRGEVSVRRRIPASPVALRGIRAVSTPSGAVEAGMLAVTGSRHRAVAVRLEARRDRWVLTELEVG